MLPEPSPWPYTSPQFTQLCRRLSEVLQPWSFPRYTIDTHWVGPNEIARQQTVTRHVHQFYEGFIILTGGIDLITPWQTQSLTPGSLLVFSPGSMHQWQTPEQACLSLCISFDVNRQLVTPTDMRWPVCLDALWDMRVLLANVAACEPGWQQRAHCHLGVIYSRLLALLERPISADPDPQSVSQLVTRIDELLLEHLADPLTVEELGELVSLSARHLSRVFRALTGTTVHKRLEAIRLERAAKLLRTTNLPVDEIAHTIGITNAAYFARRFRQRFEISPHIYRQQVITATAAPARGRLPDRQ